MKTLMTVVYYGATWRNFKPKIEEIKKNSAQKNSLYFRKWNFLPRKKLIKIFYAFDKTPLGETG